MMQAVILQALSVLFISFNSCCAVACPKAPLVYFFAGGEDQIVPSEMAGGRWQITDGYFTAYSEYTGGDEYNFNVERIGDSSKDQPEGIIEYGGEDVTAAQIEQWAVEGLLP